MLCTWIHGAHGHVGCIVPEEKQKENETIDDDDSPAERFVEDLLKLLLKGSSVKDKHVRYRSVQVIAEIVSSIGELECVTGIYRFLSRASLSVDIFESLVIFSAMYIGTERA